MTATAALTLSLAIGSATAIYSVIEVLLRPLPFADPQHLVELGDVVDGNDSEELSLPANESILLTRNPHSFQSLGAFQWLSYELSGPIPAARITASRLNASVFSTLGVQRSWPCFYARKRYRRDPGGGAQLSNVAHPLSWSGAHSWNQHPTRSKTLFRDWGDATRIRIPLVPGQLNRSEIWVPASITKGSWRMGRENGVSEWSPG